MSIETEFEMTVGGSPLPDKDIDVFERRVHGRVIKLDPDAQVERTDFARLRYRFRWYGSPVFMEKTDMVYKQVLKYLDEYLGNWEYRIVINYVESEG